MDIIYVLKAFERGADAVFVGGCAPGQCGYVDGNLKAEKRIKFVKALLDKIGFGGERLELFWIPASESQLFAQRAREMYERAKKLGPNPKKMKGAI